VIGKIYQAELPSTYKPVLSRLAFMAYYSILSIHNSLVVLVLAPFNPSMPTVVIWVKHPVPAWL